MSRFGDVIKDIRKEKKLSLKEVAKVGEISHSYLSQVENGKRNTPKPEMIKKISKGLNVPYEDLLAKAGVTNDIKEEYPDKFNNALDVIKDLYPFLVCKQGINNVLNYRGVFLEDTDIEKIIGMLDILFSDRIKEWN